MCRILAVIAIYTTQFERHDDILIVFTCKLFISV